jgi:DegV family protein with EDD domain
MSTSHDRRRFAVVTDSTADVSTPRAAAANIAVVPLLVTIGEQTYLDGDLSQAEFFARMNAAPSLPTTSQPPIGAFVDAYERALQSVDEVLSIHISSKLSGTFESARQAAERFAGKVHVFDSFNLSWGLAWQVMDAVDAAAAGMSASAALERLSDVRDQVRLLVGLDELDNLAKGGRIGRVGAFLGSLLDLKVTLTVAPDGAFVPLGRSRGEKAAMKDTLAWVAKEMGSSTAGRFAVGHALSDERACWLAGKIQERWEATELVIYEAGSVIATHTGTGWGVAVLPATPDPSRVPTSTTA